MKRKGERGFMLVVTGVSVTAVIGFGSVLYALAQWVNPRVGSETDLTKSALLDTPPAPLTEPITLKAVTFNVQNLWVVGFNRAARMRAIGEKLAELDPDVVAFQEVFVPRTREILLQSFAGTPEKVAALFDSGRQKRDSPCSRTREDSPFLASLFLLSGNNRTTPILPQCLHGQRPARGQRLLHRRGFLPPVRRVELMGFEVIHDHAGLRLSDHDGYMSTIRITPAGGE